MAGWNNHSYLFTQQTPRLTFNGCSLCSASKHPGEFDFHYRVENIRSSLLLSSLGLHEDAGFCINDEAAGRLVGWCISLWLQSCRVDPRVLHCLCLLCIDHMITSGCLFILIMLTGHFLNLLNELYLCFTLDFEFRTNLTSTKIHFQ